MKQNILTLSLFHYTPRELIGDPGSLRLHRKDRRWDGVWRAGSLWCGQLCRDRNRQDKMLVSGSLGVNIKCILHVKTCIQTEEGRGCTKPCGCAASRTSRCKLWPWYSQVDHWTQRRIQSGVNKDASYKEVNRKNDTLIIKGLPWWCG